MNATADRGLVDDAAVLAAELNALMSELHVHADRLRAEVSRLSALLDQMEDK